MRILHTMLRVGDLDKSLAFYTEVLGMRLLRRNDYPEGKFTLAFVGFQDEKDGAVIELTHNWGVDRYEIGTGYGHIALAVDDAHAACAEIRTRGGKVTREAGPMKGGSSVIAFVEDPDGYKIELIGVDETVYATTELFVDSGTMTAVVSVGQGVYPVKVTNPDGQYDIFYSYEATPSSDGHLESFDLVGETLTVPRWRHASCAGFDAFGGAYIYSAGGLDDDRAALRPVRDVVPDPAWIRGVGVTVRERRKLGGRPGGIVERVGLARGIGVRRRGTVVPTARGTAEEREAEQHDGRARARAPHRPVAHRPAPTSAHDSPVQSASMCSSSEIVSTVRPSNVSRAQIPSRAKSRLQPPANGRRSKTSPTGTWYETPSYSPSQQPNTAWAENPAHRERTSSMCSPWVSR